MPKKYLMLSVILGVLSGMVGAWVLSLASGSHPAAVGEVKGAKESVYDRVMSTQTIRCGYVVWVPFLVKDPNSGRLSGLFYDYTEALGQALHLKIEWTEEEGWGDYPAALDAGRVDAMCGGSWPNAGRARQIDFIQPILYQPTYAWVRADDTRFDNNLDAINNPAVTIVVIEGSTQPRLAVQYFPKAKLMQLPEMTSLSETFVNLVGGKADVALTTTEAAHQYDVNNPGKIRRIVAAKPLGLFGNGLAIAGGQDRFRRMLDVATQEMLFSGKLDTIIDSYDKIPDAWLRVAPPYQTREAAH